MKQATTTRNNSGGLSVTPQMRDILDQPGFLSIEMGSEKLRNMFQMQFAEFDLNKLSPFVLACMCGKFDVVKEAIKSGTAPDLTATQTPFKFGFVTLTVLGAQRIQAPSPNDASSMKHLDILAYLIASGAPLDIPDISGHTALHHACTPPIGHIAITKLLLEKGANVNAQNRYGEVPISFPFQGGDIKLIELLMHHGADLDIPDGNDDTPRKMCVIFGPEVTAAVERLDRERKGEAAPRLEENRCENCKKTGSGLRQCARCHLVRYCSTDCQRAHWKMHKPNCHSFSAGTTVTLRPSYHTASTVFSTADFMRKSFGLEPTGSIERPGTTVKKTAGRAEDKGMVIKIQVPQAMASRAPLLIYNKKRDFVCTVETESNPAAYDAIVRTVRTRGVGGAKAYFVAELKSRDELVVNISEVLATQPF